MKGHTLVKQQIQPYAILKWRLRCQTVSCGRLRPTGQKLGIGKQVCAQSQSSQTISSLRQQSFLLIDFMSNLRLLFPFCKQTHFGHSSVPLQKKQGLVNQVFDSVASNYDIMNDLMSLGIHRLWKNYYVKDLGRLGYRDLYEKKVSQFKVLDMAGGTGDIAFRILQNNKDNGVEVLVCDINGKMLQQGRKRARALQLTNVQFQQANAEELPFQANSFDIYTIAFGLRNVPRIERALGEAFRVLKPGGRISILEFSKVKGAGLSQAYRLYSKGIPVLGQLVANDRNSYKYLVQSIQRFHTQEQLLKLLMEAQFKEAKFQNLTGGVVAIHSAVKL